MVSTVQLDPDVCRVAESYAGSRGISLSAAVSELILSAEREPLTQVSAARLKRSPHGYLVIAGGGDVITAEQVADAAEDELA